MSHNVNTMMYVGTRPWHGLGVELNEPATSEEAIMAAGLDYEVKKEPLFLNDRTEVNGSVGIVRQDTRATLGIATDRYQVVQNKQAFDFFDSVVGEKQAMYETAGALGEGERIWMLAKLPKNIVVFNDDIVEKYLVLTNGHDGKSTLKVYFTPIRVVCQNTLNLSLRDATNQVSIVHRGDVMNKVKEARKVLGLALNFYDQFEESAKELVAKKFDVQGAETYFNRVLKIEEKEDVKLSKRKENIRGEMLNLFEKGKGNDMPGVRHSVWAAYNAVTEWVDHVQTVKGQKENPSNRLKNIWFGSGANMKERAYEEALELVVVR